MTNLDIYKDISARTGGAVMIGVVGPVRTGKSTFIKRFMKRWSFRTLRMNTPESALATSFRKAVQAELS